jgi:hypothetical protein
VHLKKEETLERNRTKFINCTHNNLHTNHPSDENMNS